MQYIALYSSIICISSPLCSSLSPLRRDNQCIMIDKSFNVSVNYAASSDNSIGGGRAVEKKSEKRGICTWLIYSAGSALLRNWITYAIVYIYTVIDRFVKFHIVIISEFRPMQQGKLQILHLPIQVHVCILYNIYV